MTLSAAQRAFLDSLSERAKRALDLGARPDRYAMSHDDLRRYLLATRRPAWDTLFALRAELAGLGARRAPDRADFYLFPELAHESMNTPPLRDKAGAVVAVPVGYAVLANRSIPLLLDAAGGVHLQHSQPVAESLRSMVEKLALLAEHEPPGPTTLRAAFRPRQGERLAAALGATRAEEACDRYHAFWLHEGSAIGDGHPFLGELAGDTFVWTRSLDEIARSIEVAHRAFGEQAGVEIAGLDSLAEARPPREAPEPLSPEERRARRSISTLSDEPGQAGFAWVWEPDRAVEIRREYGGRVLHVEEIYPAGRLALDYADPLEALRPHLSEAALRHLASTGVTRDLTASCARTELASAFRAKGRDLPEPIAEFEACCGGLEIAGMRLGFCAGSRRGGNLQELEGPLGEPIFVAGHLMDIAKYYYLDRHGTFYEDDRDIGLKPAPVAASWKTHLERQFSAGGLHESRPFSLLTFVRAGEAVARAFGIPALESGTDRYGAVWIRHDVGVYEQQSDVFLAGGRPVTEVASAQLNELVRAIQIILQERPEATFLVRTPRPIQDRSPPAQVPLLRAPMHTSPNRAPDKELRVYGRPGSFSLWAGEPLSTG